MSVALNRFFYYRLFIQAAVTIINKKKAKSHKKATKISDIERFWKDAESDYNNFLFVLLNLKDKGVNIPKQTNGIDCGVFPIAYADLIPTFEESLLEADTWKGATLPTMQDIPKLRKEYCVLYTSLQLKCMKRTKKMAKIEAAESKCCCSSSTTVLFSVHMHIHS